MLFSQNELKPLIGDIDPWSYEFIPQVEKDPSLIHESIKRILKSLYLVVQIASRQELNDATVLTALIAVILSNKFDNRQLLGNSWNAAIA